MDRSFWLRKAVKFVFFAALFVAVIGYLTMSLWNHLMPLIFHLPTLDFWQALGLLVLSRLLFGGFGRGRGNWAQKRRQWKQQFESRVATLSPEEREKFRQQMQRRCAPWGRRAPEPGPAATPPA